MQNSLGGRVRILISGSAPLRDDVMIFLRCALGCQVIVGLPVANFILVACTMGDKTVPLVPPLF